MAVPGGDARATWKALLPSLSYWKASTIPDIEQFPAYRLSIGELVALRFLVMLKRDHGGREFPAETLDAAWAEHAAWFESRCRLLSPSGVRDLAIADAESAEIDPFSEAEIAALQRRYGDLLVRLSGFYDEPRGAS